MRRAEVRFVRIATVVMLMSAVFASIPSATQAGRAPARSASRSGAPLPTLRWDGMVGTGTWVPTLDPTQITEVISYNIANMLHANLVKLTPSGGVAPDLATWKVSRNHLVYTFTIRHNARFSNGDPVTAQDEAWSITRALAKSTKSPVSLAYLGDIVGAKAVNDGKASTVSGLRVLNSHQLRIRVDKPIAFFLKTLTYPTADVLDPRIERGHPSQTYLTNTCAANVGAGPFRVVCRNKSSSQTSFYPSGHTPELTLEPNPYYYGHKPRIRVVMEAIADNQTSYEDFLANGIDVTPVPTPDIARNQHKPGFFAYPTSAVDVLIPNQYQAPFNNVHCRLAVAYAINRPAITNDVLHHAEVPYYDVVPRGMLGYYGGANNPHFDLAKAKAELSQCPGGLHHLHITYAKISSDLDNEMRALQAMWSQAGIDISPKPMSANAFVSIYTQPLKNTNTPISWFEWIEDYPDPYDYCSLLLRSGQNYDFGGFNNAAYNRLVDKAAVTFNQKKRASLYVQAQHIVLSQGAWISIGNANGYNMVKPYVHGLVGSPAFGTLVPANNDWSKVTISSH